MSDRRLPTLRAALGFLQVPPTESELRLLHRWLDTCADVGLITVGVARPRLFHVKGGGGMPRHRTTHALRRGVAALLESTALPESMPESRNGSIWQQTQRSGLKNR